ncbi:MAG TPA: NAD(P)H-hydrate epimerase [Elusimicrobiota bacterium]|nr:NAD(P)H-hydrate epimerase [Elusimicrobiota bacterium]
MRRIDRTAIERYKIPGLILMDHAGRAVASVVERFRPRTRKKAVSVFCGGGNNGGDGFAAARYLALQGHRVTVVTAVPLDRTSGDAATELAPLRELKVPLIVFKSSQKLLESLDRPHVVVDALLGTGAQGPLRPPYRELIDLMNGWKCPVVAADVPSGLDADTGEVPETAVRARVTVTMGYPKKGLVARRARRWVGRLLVADIGFPQIASGR